MVVFLTALEVRGFNVYLMILPVAVNLAYSNLKNINNMDLRLDEVLADHRLNVEKLLALYNKETIVSNDLGHTKGNLTTYLMLLPILKKGTSYSAVIWIKTILKI